MAKKGDMTWIEWLDFSPSGIARSKKVKTSKWIMTKSGRSFYWGKKK